MLRNLVRSIVFMPVALLLVCNAALGQQAYKSQDKLVLPEFTTAAPRYCLLTFPAGEEQRQTVLIVADGDRLFVDKNSDGDLTQLDESVLSTRQDWESDRDHLFTIDEIQVGERVHRGLHIYIRPLEKFDRGDQQIKEVLNFEPNADCYQLWAEIQDDRFQGRESAGRVYVFAEIQDLDGVLQFGKSLETAPTINWCGDLEIRLRAETKLRPGGETDIRTVVGTPGKGPGTFASIGYEGVIPAFMHPRLAIRVNVDEKEKMETTTYELSERC